MLLEYYVNVTLSLQSVMSQADTTETMKNRRMGGAKRNPSSHFETASHLPLGHHGTMKRPVDP